ncbi:MAG: glycosyltransferase family 1 protein [Saprospiraceae bacterium]|nr:glycosyltransferase family 1 protein [Saprospiraceae bacterium]
MPKLRIAFFAEMLLENYDGAIRTMHHIIKRIPKDKFEVVFICGVPPKEDIGFKVITVPTMTIPFNKNYKVALHQLSQHKLTKTLDGFKPDLVHVSTPSPLGHYGLTYAEKNEIPTSTIYHTHYLSYVDYYLRGLPLLVKPIKEAIGKNIKNFYNRCDRVFIPTKQMEIDLTEYGVKRNNMRIWARGINQNIFNPNKKDSKFLRSITGNSNPNILFASRLVWEKNLQTLINIYKKAEEEGKAWNFIIAGDGVARQALQKQMPKAIFMGKLDQSTLATVYASSDIFIFPSISETYGNVVIEAMSCGIPCVIANGGGSASFIDHGSNGYLCQPNNPADYISYAEIILENEALRNSIINSGYNYVKGKDWESVVSNLFAEWKDLILKEVVLQLIKSKKAV